MKETESLQWVCSKCGSTHFGSSRNQDNTWTRFCHNEFGNRNPCRFSAHESEDWKHYKLVKTISFDSPQEYEAARKAASDRGEKIMDDQTQEDDLFVKVHTQALRAIISNIKRGLDNPSNPAALCLARANLQTLKEYDLNHPDHSGV
jgi:hypothetical protein